MFLLSSGLVSQTKKRFTLEVNEWRRKKESWALKATFKRKLEFPLMKINLASCFLEQKFSERVLKIECLRTSAHRIIFSKFVL